LLEAGFDRVDYVAIRDAASLAQLRDVSKSARVLAAAGRRRQADRQYGGLKRQPAWFGRVRLRASGCDMIEGEKLAEAHMGRKFRHSASSSLLQSLPVLRWAWKALARSRIWPAAGPA